MKHIAVIGSTDFPLSHGAGHILRIVSNLPEDAVIVVRGDHEGVPIAGTDAMVDLFAKSLGRARLVVALDRTVPASLRGWERTQRLVGYVDSVIAFFSDMEMHGGTGMVVGHAMNKDRDVTSYTVTEAGDLREIGSTEPAESLYNAATHLEWRLATFKI